MGLCCTLDTSIHCVSISIYCASTYLSTYIPIYLVRMLICTPLLHGFAQFIFYQQRTACTLLLRQHVNKHMFPEITLDIDGKASSLGQHIMLWGCLQPHTIPEQVALHRKIWVSQVTWFGIGDGECKSVCEYQLYVIHKPYIHIQCYLSNVNLPSPCPPQIQVYTYKYT